MEPWGVSGFPASCSFPCLRKLFKRKVNNPADERGDEGKERDNHWRQVDAVVSGASLAWPQQERQRADDCPQDWERDEWDVHASTTFSLIGLSSGRVDLWSCFRV